jgi:ketosteroid isomerase-like protein
LVRKAIRAWNDDHVEALVAISSTDVEMNPVIAATVSGNTYRGHGGVRQFMRDYKEVFESFELTGDDIRDLGERVVWLGRVRATGRDSGVELDQPFAMAFELRDGKAVRFRSFLDPELALTAAEAGEL